MRGGGSLLKDFLGFKSSSYLGFHRQCCLARTQAQALPKKDGAQGSTQDLEHQGHHALQAWRLGVAVGYLGSPKFRMLLFEEGWEGPPVPNSNPATHHLPSLLPCALNRRHLLEPTYPATGLIQ